MFVAIRSQFIFFSYPSWSTWLLSLWPCSCFARRCLQMEPIQTHVHRHQDRKIRQRILLIFVWRCKMPASVFTLSLLMMNMGVNTHIRPINVAIGWQDFGVHLELLPFRWTVPRYGPIVVISHKQRNSWTVEIGFWWEATILVFQLWLIG